MAAQVRFTTATLIQISVVAARISKILVDFDAFCFGSGSYDYFPYLLDILSEGLFISDDFVTLWIVCF